ncbi:uncharacterized protein [Solanum tuberosum]|uniref:uncharacterized protein n=1 Tax=Solanum tuberosum TaxID=4113 RepID=UPI00073A2D3A|nr:PREDICTED: uncharacterized protein LOC107057909 [Solanum tuberosum]
MNIIVDETILMHDPNGEAIEMDEPMDYGLFPEHHELDEEFTEDEYETENESEEDDEEFEEEIDTDYSNFLNLLKEFYWDPSIDSQVKIQWRRKGARRYGDFISVLKKEGKRPKYISEEIWESWMSIWKKLEVIEKSKINYKKSVVAVIMQLPKELNTGGSITIGEHRKRLAIKNGHDPTPSEIHLHVHAHGNDGKSFVGERARIVHFFQISIFGVDLEFRFRYLMLVCSKFTHVNFVLHTGGENKRRIYGLGAQEKVFYGPNFRVSSGSDASGTVPCPNAQTTPTENVDELVVRMIPSLTNHLLPIFVEQIRGLISPASSQPDSPTNHPSTIAPVIPFPTATNIDEDRASVSEE